MIMSKTTIATSPRSKKSSRRAVILLSFLLTAPFSPIASSFQLAQLDNSRSCTHGMRRVTKAVSAQIYLLPKSVPKLYGERSVTLGYQEGRAMNAMEAEIASKNKTLMSEQGKQSNNMRKYEEEQLDKEKEDPAIIEERRHLGGMESFMLPRPLGPYDEQGAQYTRPPMNHIATFILSSTPSTSALREALDHAVRTHPLLRAHLAGNGHPQKWLDPLRRMVRWNGWKNEEECPLEFAVHSTEDGNSDNSASDEEYDSTAYWGGSLRIVNVPGSTRQDLDRSWQARFEHDLDSDAIVAAVPASKSKGTGPKKDNCRNLWKLELHQLGSAVANNDDDDNQGSIANRPCALVLTMNHAISDQGTVNLVMDQILSDIAELEGESDSEITSSNESSSIIKTRSSGCRTDGTLVRIKHPAVVQPLPCCLEDSLLGAKKENNAAATPSSKTSMRLNILDILESPFPSSIKDIIPYLMHQIQEAIQLPTLYPGHRAGIMDLLDSASILLFGSPVSGKQEISNRQSNVEYRTLSPSTISALVKKSKAHRVPISMTLAAAVAATCADFFDKTASDNDGRLQDGPHPRKRSSQVYKLLQSLDTRRYAGASDTGETLSCQAGGMDLMLGPLADGLGTRIRHHYSEKVKVSVGGDHDADKSRWQTIEEVDEAANEFWSIAKQAYDQTSSFLKGGDAVRSLQLFDLGMSICDIGRLVETSARSKSSMGRCWSAGITNVGEYERQRSVEREGISISERGQLVATHGPYRLEEVYYATSHARVGATFPVGCITIGGKMSVTMNPPWPLISKEESVEFADAFVGLLEAIADEDV